MYVIYRLTNRLNFVFNPLLLPNTCTVLLPKSISSAPICLWNYNLLIRPRADLPASITPLLALYCYLNNPAAYTVLLPNLCCFVCSWLTLAAPPAAKYNTSLYHCSQLILAAPPAAKQTDLYYSAYSTITDFYCSAYSNNCIQGRALLPKYNSAAGTALLYKLIRYRADTPVE
jgi:hypothetical protein